MPKFSRMHIENGERVYEETYVEDPFTITEELDAMFRLQDNIVSMIETKLSNGKTVYQVSDKNRIVLQYKEV